MSGNSHSEIDTLESLALAAIHAKEEFAKNKYRLAVLFADLCESTSYKIDRGDVDGLIKTYRHNMIVGSSVQKHGGTIIKYIGDEVMATFGGDTASANALRAAIEIQQAITIFNEKVDGAADERIHSKIGIHVGEAILVKFVGHDAADPQGKVVDATARIIALSNADQILCSKVVREELGDEFQFSTPHLREAKGIRDGIEVFEVLIDGRAPVSPRTPRHADSTKPHIRALLDAAIREELSGEARAASSRYEAILMEDPLHFAANYRRAKIAYKHEKVLRLSLSSIIEMARKAECSWPESGSAKAQTLVFEWVQYVRGHPDDGEPAYDEEELRRTINLARGAVRLANEQCDLYGEMVGMNTLAYFLALLFEKSKQMEVYKEAEQICRLLDNVISELQGRLVPSFYETYARVLCNDLDRQSLLRAKELAEKSCGMQETEQVHLTLARIAKRLRTFS